MRIKTGELLLIDKEGYENARIRIANERNPLFYNLHLDKIQNRLDPQGHLLPYQRDSLKFVNTYSLILNGSKKGENNASGGGISLDALSKKNRDRWAFQAMYEKWQNDKYVDFIFNKALISEITKLEGDDLRLFMQYYRPTYSFLRSATEYEYLDYIKKSYLDYLRRPKY